MGERDEDKDSELLTTNTLTSARATSVLTHLIKNIVKNTEKSFILMRVSQKINNN